MVALAYLTDRGLGAAVNDGRLIVTPGSKLTDGDRAFIRAHKAELMAELERRREDVLRQLSDNPATTEIGTSKRELLGDDLRLLAGDDWPEINADPGQLAAFKAAAETVALLQRGVVPEHYTSTTTCSRCGTVPIFPDVPAKVLGCPWCFTR